ncbi:MAG: TetR/AcrR family transcriptional regulator [Solirubrobacterales bacterium]|nr:TetR/AcrR family transcriptional regulator [Solirubrobacterales bacterium]
MAAHQRGRLIGAMVEAVERHGYGAVSVAEVVALAGVSKGAFYANFADKQDCFLATYEEIVELGSAQIEAAYGEAEGAEERLRAAFGAFLALATAYAPAGRLVFLASLEVGAAAVPAREQAGARFEAVLVESFAEVDSPHPVSPLVIRAIVGGTREVVYRRMHAEEAERLEAEIETLVEWGLGYHRGAGRSSLAGLGAFEAPGQTDPLDWEEPPGSKRARRELSQRERIIRATAQIAAAEGYPALTVGSISSRAGTSNQTFYANFDSKAGAFLAAFDVLAGRAFERTAEAFGSHQGWLEAGAAGIMALLGHFAADPLHRRLIFFELAAAGPEALGRAEAMLDAFIGFLEPEELPAEVPLRPPRVVLEALAGGIWAVVEHEVAAGRGDSLAELAPELIDFVLVAFGTE